MNRRSSTPPASSPSLAERVFRPLERFLEVEASSGIVLLAAAAAALIWANSPFSASYERLWHAPLTFAVGAFTFEQPLHFWINDGLMTIFFLVVGLEIRRELHEGALSNPKLAVLPVAAALGGILAPAAIYLLFNADPLSRQGWAVPTATDIAFAVGVLALLGNRVSRGLRALLLALAIIDDIAAILVIAFFYSSGIAIGGLLIAAGGLLGVLLLRWLGVRAAFPYAIPGSIVWAGLLQAGLHPTLAGVALGLLTPVASPFEREGPLAAAGRALEEFSEGARRGSRDHDDLIRPMKKLRRAQREMLPPLIRVENALHPWVAYGVMPLFALANAGVGLGDFRFESAVSSALTAGIMVGLVVGKPLGIMAASLLSVRLGLSALPGDVTWRGVLVVGSLGGIGFTMSIFIANLAFPDETRLESAKLAVLAASTLAAVGGWLLGRWLLRHRGPAD